MRDSRTYGIFPSNLSLPEAFHASDRNLVDLGYAEANNVCNRIHYDARIDSTRRLSAETWKEFLGIIDRIPNPETIDIHSHWTSEKRDAVEILISVSSREIDIEIGSTDPAVQELLHRQLKENFRA